MRESHLRTVRPAPVPAAYTPELVQRRLSDKGRDYLYTRGTLMIDGVAKSKTVMVFEPDYSRIAAAFAPGEEIFLKVQENGATFLGIELLPNPNEPLFESSTDVPRIEALRAKLFAGIQRALEIDGLCKSSEGHLQAGIEYPNYFRAMEHDVPMAYVEIYCYVLGPSRNYRWEASSMRQVVRMAERDIERWVAEMEEQYAEDMAA